MDSDLLAELVERAVADGGIDSVMVARNGYVVLDVNVHPFTADLGHNTYSMTKSVTGPLIGIAIDRGLLAGVDVPVVEILTDAAPETIDDLKAAMTVGDLLTMTTGLACRDSYLYRWEGNYERMASDDWSAYVLGLPMEDPPGTRFECNGSSFQLSAVLSEVTGMSAAEFAADVLFAPLGITDYFWPTNPDGISFGAGGLVLRPADMAKLGLLYLSAGRWDAQVLPAEWAETATAAQTRAGTLSDSYGYQWWVDDAGYVMAVGFGGQHLILVPDADLLITVTAGLPLSRFSVPERLAAEDVMPAVTSDDPLPPNAAAAARLAESVAAASSAPVPAAVDLPEVAAAIDGARDEFRDNDFGHMWFALSFEDATARLQLLDVEGPAENADPEILALSGVVDVDQPLDVTVGLDARFAFGEAFGQPVAMRGTWSSDDTFFVEYRFLHHADRGTMQFTFRNDLAQLKRNEVTSGLSQMATADRQ